MKNNLTSIALSTLLLLTACNGENSSSPSEQPVAGPTFGDVTPPAPQEAASAEIPVVITETKPEQEQPVSTVAFTESKETEQQAFDRLVPEDKVYEEKAVYSTALNASIAIENVSEETSVKRHVIDINGQKVPFAARAGHLVAYGSTLPYRPNPFIQQPPKVNPYEKEGPNKTPQASLFYTAYTRDGLPKETRPVTFIWNGGPGSSSIWLHMGSWGPMRIKSDAPTIANETELPTDLPLIENDISLLDKSDLVFIDPPGTGFSTAIAPTVNSDIWGTDIDAEVVSNFILAYINKYNRQSSPKYLYGESYGGIRTPIVANLLMQSGTSRYDPDPSGKTAQVFTGFILNSPLVDYNTNCNMTQGGDQGSMNTKAMASCAGYIPVYAFAADFHKTSILRGNKNSEQYMEELRKFTREKYSPISLKYFDRTTFAPLPAWNDYKSSTEGRSLLNTLAAYTGVPSSTWAENYNFTPPEFQGIPSRFEGVGVAGAVPGKVLGRYDARMAVSTSTRFSPDSYVDLAYANIWKDYLPNYLNYKTANNDYSLLNEFTIMFWYFKRDTQDAGPQSIADIQAVLTMQPDTKMLILHGYHDLATPGYQTELDLESVGLESRIPIKWTDGGHMTYTTESSRAPLKQAINKFYDSTPQDYLGEAQPPAPNTVVSTVQLIQ